MARSNRNRQSSGGVTIGQLRHTVRIERAVETADGFGQRVQAWEPIADPVGAKVDEVFGREYLAAAQVQSVVTHEVTIRAGIAVTPKHRLVWGERTLEIGAVLREGVRGEWLILLCHETAKAVAP
jgi:SPP1 family predicted phage head-tail adaptor